MHFRNTYKYAHRAFLKNVKGHEIGALFLSFAFYRNVPVRALS